MKRAKPEFSRFLRPHDVPGRGGGHIRHVFLAVDGKIFHRVMKCTPMSLSSSCSWASAVGLGGTCARGRRLGVLEAFFVVGCPEKRETPNAGITVAG
jgi:hypothetical protein